MGKVDGLLVELRDGRPPRVVALEIGGAAFIRRLPFGLARWMAPLARRWGLRRGMPYRVPWSKIRGFGLVIRVDVEGPMTGVYAWERWLRKHVVDRIPGA